MPPLQILTSSQRSTVLPLPLPATTCCPSWAHLGQVHLAPVTVVVAQVLSLLGTLLLV